MSNVELFELTKHYRQGDHLVKALDGVSLRIEPGEFISIVGRSGSGKTTLLDMAGLLSRPTSGTVRIDGVDTAKLRDGKRAGIRGQRVGFIFQDFNLLPGLNVVENVLLPTRHTGLHGSTASDRALDWLEEVGLADRLSHRPDQLSGGQQQRVAIARALVNHPALVLGDEPTGAVDTQTAGDLLSIMKRLNKDERVTFVIVTHDLDLAAQTERTIRLSVGRIVSDELQRQAA